MSARRIRSFTLIEMVLTMVFSAIVVGMAYTSITIFSNLYDNYSHKRSIQADFQIIKQAMISDFSKASSIEVDVNQIYLNDSGGVSRLQYVIHTPYLIRIAQPKNDSLKMDDLVVESSFEGRFVERGIIDQVVIHFKYERLPNIISVRKEYSSEELFEYYDSVQNSTLISAP